MPADDSETPGPQTLIHLWLRLDGGHLHGRTQTAFESLRRSWRAPACLTLGDVAALDATHIYVLPNCDRKTVRALQESLARAGLTVAWCAPRRTIEARHEKLRNDLAVLAAAWDSNAIHLPDSGAASAWRYTSDALDKLLETD